MSLDEFQQTWQAQVAPKLRIDAELLLRELTRNQRSLNATLLWRDFREVFVGLLLVPVSWYIARSSGWVWLSLGAAGLWIAGFILIDRWLRRHHRTAAIERPLAACVDESLCEVEHQIWLLKNVAWWYLLPCMLACYLALAYTTAIVPGPWWAWAVYLLVFAAFFFAVNYGIYWLNQYAVRVNLEPRRQELLAVRESLRESQE
jgi:hypothetical protein